MSETPILEMVDITKEFPGVKALSDVTFKVLPGEIHAICGENGAGKSTLMKVLSGVWPYGTYTGTITYKGEECRFRSIRDSEEKGIVIIHQELALIPFLSITENIFLGNEQAKHGVIDWNLADERAVTLLQRVGLHEHPSTNIIDIGVGKQQLVEIAKALAKNVELLILDEPTAALNDDDSEHLLNILRSLRDEGVTCIIISHKLKEILSIADSITVIRDGQGIETLDVRAGLTEERLIKSMVGREMNSLFPEHEPHIGEEVFKIEDWTVHHPIQAERVIVDHANLDIKAGEIVGLAGLMGSGRTEMAMSIFGETYGTNISGKIWLKGKEIATKTVEQAVKNGIAYVSEDRKRFGLNLIQTIRENMTSAAMGKVSKNGVIEVNQEIADANELRKELNVKTPSVEELVGKLSGGNQQKVSLAKWIFTDPEVLILDEPTRGIDVGAKYEIYQIINDLADQGRAVLVISSELPELIGICDRIYALAEGRITGVVDKADATQENLMQLMTKEEA
ncbi:MAG: ATP-binding cassette domain-containing protein [Propionibacteriaceae bacterium]|jgi:putative multiple sugar transport system ATP-binding protein|nr:ATP-binding cassette domain-containing protein [Propionibacteriaceae bacterium]